MAIEHMKKRRWKGHGDNWPEGHRPCTSCGKMQAFKNFHKHATCKYGVNTVCKSCRKPRSKKDYETKTIEYKLWHSAKTRADRFNKEFNITIEDIVVQNKCPVFGVEYVSNTPYAPSLDRLDNSKGYVKGNIIVMSKRANALKGDATIEELKKLVAFLESCEIL